LDAIGIRLQDGDDFPYFAQQGFSRDFLLTENTLVERAADGGVCRDKDGNVSLECTCGLVISGQTDPVNPHFTRGGSCWTNDRSGTPFRDTRLHPRDRCLRDGFQSVALVPIRNKDGIVGLIHLNDRRKGCFTLEPVELLEGIASHIGEALMRKRAEEELRKAEEKYRSLVENINDVFYALDTQGNITYVSPVVERFTLYKVSDLIGRPFIPLIYPDDLPALLDSFNRLVSGHLEPWEFRILDKDGRVIWVRTSSRPQYQDGETVGITALMTDITERKRMEQKLEEMATHDFLTGLPNRVLLLDRFNIAAALAHRNKARLAVMSLDLDRFKTINDTLGHDAGDQVLKAVSTRLTGIIRASDTLARIGGDEFILVMMETNHVEDATAIAQKILDSFAEPLSIEGRQLHLTTSIGIAVYPTDAQDMETLTKQSDAAMYYSKGHGRNRFKFFNDGDVRVSGDHRSAPLI
jgi:diguanylate cyclase (GGDEF)-like protein/PAS domain S-box-containing protein